MVTLEQPSQPFVSDPQAPSLPFSHSCPALRGWAGSPSSGAELSAELPLSELPEEAALLAGFFMAPFFSTFLAFPFFLFLLLPNVHYKEGKKENWNRTQHFNEVINAYKPVLLKGRQEDLEFEASLELHGETVFKNKYKIKRKRFLFSVVEMAPNAEGWHAGFEHTGQLSTHVGLRKTESFLQEKTTTTGRQNKSGPLVWTVLATLGKQQLMLDC